MLTGLGDDQTLDLITESVTELPTLQLYCLESAGFFLSTAISGTWTSQGYLDESSNWVAESASDSTTGSAT